MFTGIIEKRGTVVSVESTEARDGMLLRLSAPFDSLDLGESVAINGVCLTVIEFSPKSKEATFFVSLETLDRTSLRGIQKGSIVNLERALLPTTRLSGHIVQGHVDGLATFKSAKPIGDTGSFNLEFELPENLTRYVVEKGSITVDGISLTVNEIHDQKIRITVIPHTWTETKLSALKPSDSVNIEVDVIAKYVEKMGNFYAKIR